jgi:hypothetical protein
MYVSYKSSDKYLGSRAKEDRLDYESWPAELSLAFYSFLISFLGFLRMISPITTSNNAL